MPVQNGRIPRQASQQDRLGGGRVQRRKARTRAALLAAARELFADRGLQHTTIAEIAEQADIAIGSFYNYFPTKEELLEALLEEELAKQLDLLQLRQAQVDDPAEKISIAHRHLVETATSDPDWAWLLLRLDVHYRAIWATMGRAAASDLNAGIAAGRFHVADRTVALNASGGALFAVINAELLGGLGPGAANAHAEGVLRSFGLERGEAAEIAGRPLPEVPRRDGGAAAS